MKKIAVLVILCLLFIQVSAQQNADSLAYQLQRSKINNMLSARSDKFGQYQQSLSQHTGIFGLQTKKDIRHSNEILEDIVNTDNDIFQQLKILLDYRAYQQTAAQSQSKETENTNLAYMNSINRLRTEVEKLKAAATEQEKQQDRSRNIYIAIILFMFASILVLAAKKRVVKA